MGLHEVNSRYLGISLVGVAGLVLGIWSVRLSYHPAAPWSVVSRGDSPVPLPPPANGEEHTSRHGPIGTGRTIDLPLSVTQSHTPTPQPQSQNALTSNSLHDYGTSTPRAGDAEEEGTVYCCYYSKRFHIPTRIRFIEVPGCVNTDELNQFAASSLTPSSRTDASSQLVDVSVQVSDNHTELGGCQHSELARVSVKYDSSLTTEELRGQAYSCFEEGQEQARMRAIKAAFANAGATY
jgi:hypothetical protein